MLADNYRPERNPKVRSFNDGEWLWIPKAVVREHGSTLKPLGVAVYAVLAAHCNQEQYCFPSQGRIADNLGYSRSSVNRALKMLSHKHFVQIEKKHGRCSYRLLELRSSKEANGMSHGSNSDVAPVDTNDNTLSRIHKNDTIDRDFQNFKPQTKEELLAKDLAEGLDDLKGLRLYLSYAKKYPESLLRQILGQIKEMPQEKIKRSRGALFTYLVKRYGEKHF